MLIDHLTPNIDHSYKNYHCKGLNYVNFLRTPELTIKIYSIKGMKDRQLVAPHDHGYVFETKVIKGKVRNILFAEVEDGQQCWRFKWDRKYFSEPKQRFIDSIIETDYGAGESYSMGIGDMHTIMPLSNDVVLLLFQYETVCQYTFTWLSKPTPPSLKGLYQRFDPTEFQQLVEEIRNP